MILRDFVRRTADSLRSTKKSSLPFNPTIFKPAAFLAESTQYSGFSVGKFSYGINAPLVFNNTTGDKSGSLKIGKFCSIGSGVIILLGGEHRPDWVTTYPFSTFFGKFKDYKGTSTTKGDVIIGSDVWIGMNVLILSGVTVGDGAVIGAGSVVTKDIQPYAIVAGNPAKLIRKRFDQDTIDRLLEIKWWDWDAERINENMALLLSNNLKEFISKNLQ